MPTFTGSQKASSLTSSPPQLLGSSAGISVIDPSTVLARQWFFDGKFLRAEGFRADQAYLRALVGLSNMASGFGVVHGFDVEQSGDALRIGAGLALSPSGRVIHMPGQFSIGIAELLERSSGTFDPGDSDRPADSGGFLPCPPTESDDDVTVVQPRSLYVLTVAAADALCGHEERYGALCEDACDTDADRSTAVDGVRLRLREVVLDLPTSAVVSLTGTHHRGRVASAYFADEPTNIPALVSGSGLRTPVWCQGAEAVGGEEVRLALLDRSGGITSWVDGWIARRELMETSPRRYWQWRMAMRPWDVFMAQVLQFQCQLLDQGTSPADPGSDDPCAEERGALAAATAVIDELDGSLQGLVDASGDLAAADVLGPATFAQLNSVRDQIAAVLTGEVRLSSGSLLIDGGLVDTPSGGYLPVDPQRDVREQVTTFFGPGVDLRFCAVRADYIPEALQEAQHMARISLTRGIDDPDALEEVDVLVPGGTVGPAPDRTGRIYTGAVFPVGDGLSGIVGPGLDSLPALVRETLDGWSWTLLAAGTGQDRAVFGSGGITGETTLMWLDGRTEQALSSLPTGASTALDLRIVLVTPGARQDLAQFSLEGTLRVLSRIPQPTGRTRIDVTLNGTTRTTTVRDNEVDVEPPIAVTAEGLRLLIGPAANGGETVQVQVSDGSPPLLGRAGRSGTPRQIEGLLSVFVQAAATAGSETLANVTNQIQSIAGLDAIERPDGLRAESATVAAANAAINRIATVLATHQIDDGFATMARRRLLSSGPAEGDGRAISATTDWVMFHRRRTIVCDDAPVDRPTATRRFRIFHRTTPLSSGPVLSSGFGAPPFAAAGLNRAVLDRAFLVDAASFDEVGVVEFEDGGSTLRSSVSKLLAAWGNADRGEVLTAAAIGDLGQRESSAISLGRLATLQSVLPISSSQTRELVLDEVPDAFRSDDVHGVVLLLGGPQPVKPEEPVEPEEPVGPETACVRLLVAEEGASERISILVARALESTEPITLGALEQLSQASAVARFEDGQWTNEEELRTSFDFRAGGEVVAQIVTPGDDGRANLERAAHVVDTLGLEPLDTPSELSIDGLECGALVIVMVFVIR